jgi:putative hydrolase of the HAD superfamily
MTGLPRAILFDMDDTLISAYAEPELAWLAIAGEFAHDLHPLDTVAVARAIAASSDRFWADEARHRWGRHNLLEARSGIVADAFAALNAERGAALPDTLPVRMAERYATYRDEQMYLFEGVHAVIDALRERGVRLALVTNGAGPAQRRKIERFELGHRFHHIQIEGEHRFGKPEEHAYRHAMQALDVEPHETWMVGDNLEWEVAAPQRLGIHAIWHDALGRGLPPNCAIRPDRIIRSLLELLPDD